MERIAEKSQENADDAVSWNCTSAGDSGHQTKCTGNVTARLLCGDSSENLDREDKYCVESVDENTEHNNERKTYSRKARQKHENCLNEVVRLQKDVLVEIQTMRRKIIDLESKKKNILEEREECEKFLEIMNSVEARREHNP